MGMGMISLVLILGDTDRILVKMASISTTVTWNWGQGHPKGKVVKQFQAPIRTKFKGKKITRKGTQENPAYLIEQEDGIQVLKLHSELNFLQI